MRRITTFAIGGTLALGVAVYVVATQAAPLGDYDPVLAVRSQQCFAPLMEGETVDFRVRSAVRHNSEAPSRVLVSTLRVYPGPLEKRYVDAVMEAGKADALEMRLAPKAKREVRKRIEELSRMLTDVTQSATEESERIIAELVAKKENVWTGPGPRDAAGLKRLAARVTRETRKATKNRRGAVATTQVGGKPAYVLIERSTYPEYWGYLDMQAALLEQRQREVAAAIRSLYARDQLAILHEGATRGQ